MSSTKKAGQGNQDATATPVSGNRFPWFPSSRIAHFQIQRQIRAKLTELGTIAYEWTRKGKLHWPAGKGIQERLEAIRSLQERLLLHERAAKKASGRAKPKKKARKKKKTSSRKKKA